MKNILFIFIVLSCFAFTQSVDIKDSAGQTLMQVNDEGDNKASITIPNSNSAPNETANKLYNLDGTLTWDGNALGAGGSSLWTESGENIFRDNNGNVGIGTNLPEGILDLNSTSGALIVPRMTSTQRDNLPIINGSIIYNTTSNEFNFYEDGSWVGF